MGARLAALLALLAGWCVLAPFVRAVRPRWRWLAGAAAAAAAGALGGGAAAALAAGFCLCVSAVRPGAAGGVIGLSLLAAPFLLDPFLESPAGAPRPLVRTLLCWASPAMGMARALEVDWLRTPGIYERLRLPQYHPYGYPDPWLQSALFVLLAAALFFSLGAARGGT